jgi:hypothetical protein
MPDSLCPKFEEQHVCTSESPFPFRGKRSIADFLKEMP